MHYMYTHMVLLCYMQKRTKNLRKLQKTEKKSQNLHFQARGLEHKNDYRFKSSDVSDLMTHFLRTNIIVLHGSSSILVKLFENSEKIRKFLKIVVIFI